jgi:uncharacterized Zn finger protein (UPF0148 family)
MRALFGTAHEIHHNTESKEYNSEEKPNKNKRIAELIHHIKDLKTINNNRERKAQARGNTKIENSSSS